MRPIGSHSPRLARHSRSKVTCLLLAALVPAIAAAPLAAQTASPAPATLPASVPPATQPSVSPEAKELLSKLDAAYRNLTALTLAGTVSANIDIAGQAQNESRPFTAAFSADKIRFRHDAPGEILAGFTGESLYAYRPASNAYVTTSLPAKRLSIVDLPQPYQMILRTQNPSLMLALSDEPAAELIRSVDTVARAPDLTLAGVAYPALTLSSADGTVVTVAIDPKTSLLRQVAFDLRKLAEAPGAPAVKSALLTNDFITITVASPTLPEFAWSAPAGAQDEGAAVAAGEQMDEPSAALENKPAPDFTLRSDDDKEVKLSDLKGSVVILDFWATWCPPCREGLPALDALAKENAGKPVKVFAVNLRETKAIAGDFKAKTSLGLPILFDADGATADLYKVTGIPQTVIIDKTGVVRKVVIGFNPAHDATLKKLVTDLAAK